MGGVTALHVPDPDDRSDLGAFVGRVVRLDQTSVVRLRATGAGRVTVWASTPFDVLATRTVPGNAGARRRHDLRRRRCSRR